MWNSSSESDILDFALLWQPLGGPPPENITAAFSIDIAEYHHRLRMAARSALTRLRCDNASASPERIYGLAAMTELTTTTGSPQQGSTQC